ncbi:uncharacterized protein LOC133131441 [Conger conger]|uniref:uncharacterized protein LOC133131441 n=1 Tax=Conger conger TaxID=82655 RepID=UPI002A59D1D0|nr:uncharacterized protein LOC133131441 [Conger conger]
MDRSFTGYLSTNSSAHLNSHYMDVHRSLSPEQFGTFNHSLWATLGESGKVTQGGVGVVALALSFLFDILTQQAKNQTRTTHFIHQIFRECEDGNSSEIGTVITDYLKLVPLIANDPQRMKEETDRYEQRLNSSLVSHFESIIKTQNDSWTEWKIFIHSLAFHQRMMIHQVRMGANISTDRLLEKDWEKTINNMDSKGLERNLEDFTNIGERLRSICPEKHQLLTDCKDIDRNIQDLFTIEAAFMLTYKKSSDPTPLPDLFVQPPQAAWHLPLSEPPPHAHNYCLFWLHGGGTNSPLRSEL